MASEDSAFEAHKTAEKVARASRYDGLNDPKLSELLPELSGDEIRVLGENIEHAIEKEVEQTLKERSEQ